MILVALFISLAIVLAVFAFAISEALLFGTPPGTRDLRPVPMPRPLNNMLEIELTADSGVFIVS